MRMNISVIVMITLQVSTILSLLLHAVKGCEIHGTDSGVCTYRYLPETYINATTKEKKARQIALTNWANDTDGPCKNGEGDHCMPFCGRYIAAYYPVCTPTPNALERDQNFPNGRFQDHNTRSKDRWVEEQVTSIIDNRIAIETNRTARRLGVDEYGRKGTTKIRFHKNKDCRDAYTRYMCWLNFPRCGEYYMHFVLLLIGVQTGSPR